MYIKLEWTSDRKSFIVVAKYKEHAPRPDESIYFGEVNMLEKEIEKLKQQLDQMILTEKLGSTKLLQHSQTLDILLVDYMRRGTKLHNTAKSAS